MKKPLDIRTRQQVGEIIAANLNYIVRFATIRIGDKAEAEDIVHAAVVKLLETDIVKIHRDSIRMYLFKIVLNLCRDYYNSTEHLSPLPEDNSHISDTTCGDNPDAEEIERLNAALEILPDVQKEVIRMNVMDELSFVEISRILSIPQSTVKSRFKSGINKLRASLELNRVNK